MALALVGGLSSLVSGASIVFLLVFGTVDLLAWRKGIGYSLVAIAGAAGSFAATVLLIAHLGGFL